MTDAARGAERVVVMAVDGWWDHACGDGTPAIKPPSCWTRMAKLSPTHLDRTRPWDLHHVCSDYGAACKGHAHSDEEGDDLGYHPCR
eukprot:37251-Eustigmatos_ZCMA.PRE.1